MLKQSKYEQFLYRLGMLKQSKYEQFLYRLGMLKQSKYEQFLYRLGMLSQSQSKTIVVNSQCITVKSSWKKTTHAWCKD